MKLLFTLLLGLIATASHAQLKISGTVSDAVSGRTIEYANVIVQPTDLSGMYTYAMTDTKGFYSIDANIEADSVAITVTGINLEPTIKRVPITTTELNFSVRSKVLEIREVKVERRAPAMRRGGDTITYFTAKYIDENDEAIEDVIKKLPGVTVEVETGKIAYQGKEISRLYVEGLDMLGGRYAIASKNIEAKDVKSIEVLENHQHVRALKEIARPDNAAMNINLHDHAKGTWTGSLLLGGGYSPLMWKAEGAAMFFGKRMQSINTYKTNNMGDNVAREGASIYGGAESPRSIIGVQLPTTPPLDENLYLNNNVHALASNFLFKLSETLQLKVNGTYSHDYQQSEDISTTVHNVVGGTPIVLQEQTYAAKGSDRLNLDLQLEDNRDKTYINNKLYLRGDLLSDYGRVLSNGSLVEQEFSLPSLSARNNLQLIIPLKNKVSLRINSDIGYNNQPTSLDVTPMLFPEIFGSPVGYPNVQQTLNSSKFTARNSIFTSLKSGHWDFALGVGLNAHIEDMTSQLMPLSDGGATLQPTDAMRNDIKWQRFDVTVGPSIIYKYNDNFSISAYIFADMMSLESVDRIRSVSDRLTKVIVNPSLSLNGRITQDLKYSASANYSEYYGGLYDSYGGFIMTDYRNIATKDGELRHTKSQNYSASLNYANALDLIFGNIDGSYWVADNNITYGYTYDGALTLIESVLSPNRSSGYGLLGKFSKQFLGISTLFSIGGEWSRVNSEIIRQGDLLNSQSDFYRANFGFNTRFAKWLIMDYEVEYTHSQSIVESISDLAPVEYIKQEGELLFSFGKRLSATVEAEHYYNGTLMPDYRHLVFLGATLTYKADKFAYSLEGRNLLGTESYSSAFISDITDYRYTYALRPTAIIATIRLSF